MILHNVPDAGAAWPPEGYGLPPAGWQPLYGAEWYERDGVFHGRGHGLGPFWFGALVRADLAPLERYRVSVELQLGTATPLPYAGLVFGAQSTRDFFAAYFFDAEKERGSRMDPKLVKEHHAKHGTAIKCLRVARIVRGQWEPRGELLVSGPDEGYVPLAIESLGEGRIAVEVATTRQEVTLDRPTDGRVGIMKYYDTTVHFRRFSVTAR